MFISSTETIYPSKLIELNACKKGRDIFEEEKYKSKHTITEAIIALLPLEQYEIIYWLCGKFMSLEESIILSERIVSDTQKNISIEYYSLTPTLSDIKDLATLAESKRATVERDLLRGITQVMKIYYNKNPKILCEIYKHIKTLDHGTILTY